MKTFELVINEDSKSGVDYIALVDEPAIESNWEAFKKEELAETFNDYPEAASNNAQRAIDYKEENGSDCGTRVGWTRARQLANKENISWDTIGRMASFNRHQQHKDVPYSEGCGGLMWDAWGGSAGINWAISKMKQRNRAQFKIQDQEKRIVSGYFMIADKPIYRNNKEMGEHNVIFSGDTIRNIAYKFMRNGFNSNTNLMHDENLQLNDVFVFESIIVDSKRGVKAPEGFEDVADGSWWGSMHVMNDKVWELIKEGKFQGFSVEGFFQYKSNEAEKMRKIEEILTDVNTSEDHKLQELENVFKSTR